MRDIADQAYLQMRQALVDLHESQVLQDVGKDMLNRARLIGQRSGFKVVFEETGESRPLDAHVNRQLIYVLREGLHNIEKHSHASQVNLALHWQTDQLEVILRDNGSGFDSATVDHSQHFGLEIMQEVAWRLPPGPARAQRLPFACQPASWQQLKISDPPAGGVHENLNN